MPKSQALLSILILNYNTKVLTINCLKSIYQDTGINSGEYEIEIILVDNSSSDGSVEAIKQLAFNNLKLIANKTNLGFAKGNNQALKIATGQYILFLNSDTLIKNSAITQCLTWLSAHPEAIACTPKLENPDGSIQATGGYFPKLLNTLAWLFHIDDLPLINKLIRPIHPHTPQFYTRDTFYQKDQILDWLTGAFILTRRNVLEKVKGFDENYFMYGEELELFYRLKQAFPLLKAQYLCGPSIVHFGGASSPKKDTKYNLSRDGILYYFQKHHPFLYPLFKILFKFSFKITQNHA